MGYYYTAVLLGALLNIGPQPVRTFFWGGGKMSCKRPPSSTVITNKTRTSISVEIVAVGTSLGRDCCCKQVSFSALSLAFIQEKKGLY